MRELLERLPRPDHPVRVSVPEGYAYYGLFPETYAACAVRLFKAKTPEKVACIGIRSIGTSLSAVVAGQLKELDCEVRSWTVRPGGHPFDHQLDIDPDTEKEWRDFGGATFAIVDEGPWLSGSSFASVAEAVSALGVPDDRICFLPAWNASGDSFRSETARKRWLRHEKYTMEPPPRCGIDISAGKWRSLLYTHESHFPLVQPQHEARKYLCSTPRGPELMKFEGLGVYGREKLDIARQLTQAGFSPPVLRLENGYLVTRFIGGRPLGAGEADRELLDTMARYLAFRRKAFPREDATPVEELCRMIEFNTAECQAEKGFDEAQQDRPCLVDGRMLPQEWLATTSGYLKVDALDHGNNHFCPGPTDIAWDLAGAAVEFRLGEKDREYLVDTYADRANDRSIRERLPFYRAGYLAFRLGYMSLNGFHDAAAFYRDALSERKYVCQ